MHGWKLRIHTHTISSCYAFASHGQNSHHMRPSMPSEGRRQFGYHRILRGGSFSSSPTPSTPHLATSTGRVSLHASAQSQSSSPSTRTSQKSLFDRAQESLAIAGSASEASLKSFGGLSFRDSLAEKEPFRVLFILGGPGAGKGTQCELLKQNYPCVHLSAGQLLREEAAKQDESEHAALIEECLVAGKIVPVEISLALLRNAMKASDGQSLLFLIDGFPRNFDNLEGWTRVMSTGSDAAAVWGVLSYDCPLQILEKRVMERSKESGRSDDNLESLRRRFKTFQAETVPVVDTLRLVEKDTQLKVVDIAGDQSLEKVWEETQKMMNIFVANDVLSANTRLLKSAVKRDVETYRSLCADEIVLAYPDCLEDFEQAQHIHWLLHDIRLLDELGAQKQRLQNSGSQRSKAGVYPLHVATENGWPCHDLLLAARMARVS
ncbi:uridylate kinase [Nitzschia inconspicua]|uniref:Uridylate kinase n=1 Tax=Nitzschia inconspicua TaxID=303405 RepID=A0A9K3Q7Q8_9STRA|nr:uridylate kinase [Nitzschia inconspicua]